MRDGFRSGKIRLLDTEYDGEVSLGSMKGYKSLDPEWKLAMQLPYINTTLLINELINLRHEESAGMVRLFRSNGIRKDRYSSLSYAYWVACQLESKIRRRRESEGQKNIFLFRAPKIK